MKRQSLTIGGALLATTALSTAAMAGTVINLVATTDVTTTVLTAQSLSSQIFGATAGATRENLVIGGTGAATVNFANSFTTTFDVDLSVDGGKFTGTAGIQPFTASGAATTSLLGMSVGSYGGCTVQVLTERILIEDCVGSGDPIDAMSFSGLSFNQANGLSTVGNSISVSGVVRGQSNNTFETISSGKLVTSANSASASVTVGTAANINNSASPAFSGIGASGTTTATASHSLGTVNVTVAAVVDHSFTAFASAGTNRSTYVSDMEFAVTHGVLSDAATTAVVLSKASGSVIASTRASSFVGSTVSFDIGAADVGTSFDITVNFDGTTAISAWGAGTLDLVFSAGSVNAQAPAGASGTLAALARGGFSTEFNTMQSSEGTGATFYQSLIRVTNNGTSAGTVTLAVRDDADGSLYGNYTTASIGVGSSLQISMPTVETALGITAAGQYRISLSGSISGYAQHVMFNSVNNTFVDLSGFRAATP